MESTLTRKRPTLADLGKGSKRSRPVNTESELHEKAIVTDTVSEQKICLRSLALSKLARAATRPIPGIRLEQCIELPPLILEKELFSLLTGRVTAAFLEGPTLSNCWVDKEWQRLAEQLQREIGKDEVIAQRGPKESWKACYTRLVAVNERRLQVMQKQLRDDYAQVDAKTKGRQLKMISVLPSKGKSNPFTSFGSQLMQRSRSEAMSSPLFASDKEKSKKNNDPNCLRETKSRLYFLPKRM